MNSEACSYKKDHLYIQELLYNLMHAILIYQNKNNFLEPTIQLGNYYV